MYKTLLTLLLLIPSLCSAYYLPEPFTDAELKANFNRTMNCTRYNESAANEYYSSGYNQYTSNAQTVITARNGGIKYVEDNAAGTDNVNVGWSPTTALNTSVTPHQSTSSGAVSILKAINIYYSYGGVSKVFQIPAGAYWSTTSTAGIRKADGTTQLYLGQFNNSTVPFSLTYYGDFREHSSFLPDTGYHPEAGNKLKVTAKMPNNTFQNFYMHCNSIKDNWDSLN
jgi:hypothetical protein